MSEFAEYLRSTAAAEQAALPPDTVFAEEPVSLSVFVQDRHYLGNPPLSAVQYDAVRHIERIYYPDLYPTMAKLFDGRRPGSLHIGAAGAFREEAYWAESVRMANFITLQWGKGSGKDHVARVASMRIAYLLICLHSPQQYYGMPDQDTIHLLNVAPSSGNAQQAFFGPIVRAVKKGWFKEHCDPRQNLISYSKNVESISGHSDAETQEGLNLLLGIADEIDAFKSKKETQLRRGASGREPTKSAEGILNMMRTSGATRFPETFKNVRISFPRYLGSTIQRLTDDARADIKEHGKRSRHYVSGPLATWEVNPRVKGRESFAQDYRDDPVMAKAKYECKPARAVNPFFRNAQAVDAAFVPRDSDPVSVGYGLETTAGSNRRVWVPQYTFARDFFPVRGAVYAMHADLAVSGDRAGLAMAHVAKWSEHQQLSEDEDGAFHALAEVRPHVKVDFVLSYTADTSADPPREIQIRWARQLCFELRRQGFNIALFTFDTFQSFDSMQILRDHGIDCEKVSTDLRADVWRNLRDLMYEGRLAVPRPPVPATQSFLLRDELLSLTKLPNGRIDHPADGSKDEADALACAVLGAVTVGGAEEDTGERASYGAPDIEIGRVFDLPFGVNAARVWESELPELPIY